MRNLKISNTPYLRGTLSAPASKSHSMRALLFAALARGTSQLRNILDSPDVQAMINACEQLGASYYRVSDSEYRVVGVAGMLRRPMSAINAGNSGQVFRFISALVATLDVPVIVTGDHSIRSIRPIKPYIDSLGDLGVRCESTLKNDFAPIEICGPMCAGSITIDGSDSQLISGLLIAASQAEGKQVIHVQNPGELPWIGMTLHWLDLMGIQYVCDNYSYYSISGKTVITGFDYNVPGDFSSIAFPLVAALITNSEMTIAHVDMSDVQGDKKIIDIAIEMGAQIKIDHANYCVNVLPSQNLKGGEFNINNCIDAITILAVLGCFAEGETVIRGAAIARQKECNRIKCIVNELAKMGADIKETEDGLVVKRSQLVGAKVYSYADHRVAMSLAVAGLAATGETEIKDTDCIAKSYKDFIVDMKSVEANIWEC